MKMEFMCLILCLTLVPIAGVESRSGVSESDGVKNHANETFCVNHCECEFYQAQAVFLSLPARRFHIKCHPEVMEINYAHFILELEERITEKQIQTQGEGAIMTNFWISGSPLQETTAEMCNLTMLTVLNLTQNKLGADFLQNNCIYDNLTNVRLLDLSRNHFNIIPKKAFRLSVLMEFVSLSDCGITRIETDAFILDYRTRSPDYTYDTLVLSLDSNRLTTVDCWHFRSFGEFFLLPRETSSLLIDLSCNLISRATNVNNRTNNPSARIPDGFFSHWTGVEMKLRNNKLTDILGVFDIWNLDITQPRGKTIVNIDFGYVEPGCDCTYYFVYDFLVEHTTIECMPLLQSKPEAVGTALKDVPKEDLLCPLADDCPVGCSCTQHPHSSIVRIICGSNYTTNGLPHVLPTRFVNIRNSPANNTYRYDVIIQNTSLYEITEADWPYLNKLSQLDVSRNNLKYISPDFLFILFENRISFNVRDNLLTKLHFPDAFLSIAPWPKTIDVSGNPWSCDCNHGNTAKFWLWASDIKRLGILVSHNLACGVGQLENVSFWDKDLSAHSFCSRIPESRGCSTGCICTQPIDTHTIHVNCSDGKYTGQTLPHDIPRTSEVYDDKGNKAAGPIAYDLVYTNSSLISLDWRSYLNNSHISLIDASWNCITYVSYAFLKAAMTTSTVINLRGNQLHQLDLPYTNLNLQVPKHLDLTHNPLSCDCNRGNTSVLWNWLHGLTHAGEVLVSSENIRCGPGKDAGMSLLQFKVRHFCEVVSQETVNYLLIGGAGIVGSLILIVSAYKLTYRYRVWIYTRFRIRLYDNDECEGENVDYDVFFSYARQDGEVVRELCDFLESEGYKVCIHERDFLCGQQIMMNIERAIESSKRTICFLSTHFLGSEVCLFEFECAMESDLKMKRNRLKVVLLETIDLSKNKMIQSHVKMFTYIKHESDGFMGQLQYALAKNKLGGNTASQSYQNKGYIPLA